MNNGFTKVTDVPHTKLGRIRDSLAAWTRGLINIHRMKRLAKKNPEGNCYPGQDLRAGYYNGSRRK